MMNFYQSFEDPITNASKNWIDIQGTAGIPGRDDDRKLFIGGITKQTRSRELKEYFSKFGDVEGVKIKLDSYTGQSRGFAFIVFSNSKTIEKVLASGDHYINNRKVNLRRITKRVQQGKIFVGGLTSEITEQNIRDFFGQFGTIVDIQSPIDKVKNKRKGYCFITFDSKDVVYELLKSPKQVINGKTVDVKKVSIYPENLFGVGRSIPGFRGHWSVPTLNYGLFGPEYGYGYDFSYDCYGLGYDGLVVPGNYGTSRSVVPQQFQQLQPY